MHRINRLLLAVCLLFLSSYAFGASDLIGTPGKAFQEEILEGGTFDLTPYLGAKAIMLDFWSIYCVSCVQEMPYLAKIQEKYPKDLLTVGVDLDSFGTARVKKFVDGLNFKIPYTIVVDKRRKVAGLYQVSVLPTTIIIDKKGNISYYHVGYKPGDEAEIEAEVRKAAGLK